ncbi:UPF0104 family protein [Candidatus Woesearchaeota archaeon]|nr:MAG: UPF0104 family protein [Candidatus Woesearchaeota archaeon]
MEGLLCSCMQKRLTALLRALFGASILLLLILHVGVKNILSSFDGLKPIYLPIVLLLYLVSYSMGMFNIAVLLIPLRKHVPLRRLFKYSLLGSGMGALLPGRVGELSIVYFLKKEGIPLGKASALVLVDRMVTFVFLISVSFLSFLIYFSPEVLYILLSVVAFSALFIYVFLAWGKGRSLIKKRILKRHHYLFRGFFRTFKNFIRYYRNAVYFNFFLTVLKWLFYASAMFALFMSFSVRLNFFYIFIIETVVSLLSLIPVSISGMGIKESAAVFFYSLLGVLPSVTLAVYLVLQFSSLVLAALFSALFWKDIKNLASSVRRAVSLPRKRIL